MVFGFYFNKTLFVSRRHRDGSVEEFTTSGVGRMEYSVNTSDNNRAIKKCQMLISPELKIAPGDIIDDGNGRIQILKVEELRDIDGRLQCYRAESV